MEGWSKKSSVTPSTRSSTRRSICRNIPGMPSNARAPSWRSSKSALTPAGTGTRPRPYPDWAGDRPRHCGRCRRRAEARLHGAWHRHEHRRASRRRQQASRIIDLHRPETAARLDPKRIRSLGASCSARDSALRSRCSQRRRTVNRLERLLDRGERRLNAGRCPSAVGSVGRRTGIGDIGALAFRKLDLPPGGRHADAPARNEDPEHTALGPAKKRVPRTAINANGERTATLPRGFALRRTAWCRAEAPTRPPHRR